MLLNFIFAQHATAKELEHQKEEQQRAHSELIRHKEQLQQLTVHFITFL